MNIFRKIVWKLLGISQICDSINSLNSKFEDRTNTLFFFLNAFENVKKFPKEWNEDLYIMQQCDVQLLRIVDALLSKYEIPYWLDFGTLLGAVRHEGFIPWDDDMDISTTKENYQKILEILPVELRKFNIDINESEGRIGVSYMHKQTGIWLDIFPYEEIKFNGNSEELSKDINIKNQFWLAKGWSLLKKKKIRDLMLLHDEIFCYSNGGLEKFYYLSPLRFCQKIRVVDETMIFPLQPISFSGYKFYSPFKTSEILQKYYGVEYMGFPKSGVLHHDLGRGALSSWAKKSGVSMVEIYSYLKSVADKLCLTEDKER